MSRTITITITGEEAPSDEALTAYATSYGWTATVIDENGDSVANPTTALKFTKETMRGHFNLIVSQYYSEAAAQATREQVMASTLAQLETITVETVVE